MNRLLQGFRGGLGLLLALVLAGSVGCRQQPEEREAGKGGTAPVVAVVLPRPVEETATLRLTGQVEPLHQSALGFQVSGRIVSRAVKQGERVRAGQLLMRLDDTDYRLQVQGLEAQLAALRSDLETARRQRQRVERLLARKLASRETVDQARNAVVRLEKQLRQLKTQLDQARNRLAYARLTAPFDGIVLQIQAERGQVVGAGTPVLTLAQPERAARFAIPESGVASPPDTLMVRWQGSMVRARLYERLPMADRLSRTWMVRYQLPEEVSWPLGATISTDWPVWKTAERKAVWTVPIAALDSRQGRHWLYQVENGHLQQIEVRVERLRSEQAWVTGPLQADRPVVAMGVHLLKPGQAVRVKQDG